jgi:hypothetical protein
MRYITPGIKKKVTTKARTIDTMLSAV